MFCTLAVRLVGVRASPKLRSRDARANPVWTEVRSVPLPATATVPLASLPRGLRQAPLETLSLSHLASRRRVTSCGTIFSIARQGSGCRVWHRPITSLPPLRWTTFPKCRRKTPHYGGVSSSPFGTSCFRINRRRGHDRKDTAVASRRSVSARQTLMQGRHT